MKKTLCTLIVLIGILCLCSCSIKCQDTSRHSDGYLQGYADAMEQREEQCEDAIQNFVDNIKCTDTYGDVALMLQEDAIDYVRETCDWHPEEAIYIIQAYESGEKYYGSHLITEADYHEAIRTLCRFYSYFLEQEYK